MLYVVAHCMLGMSLDSWTLGCPDAGNNHTIQSADEVFFKKKDLTAYLREDLKLQLEP